MIEVEWGDTARYGRIEPAPAERTPEEQAEIERLEARQAELAELDDEAWTEELFGEAESIETRLDEIEGGIEARATWRRVNFGMAGCIVTIAHDGTLQVIHGLVRPEETGVGIGLADGLRSIRTALVKAYLAGNFEAAFDLMLFQLGRSVFTDGYRAHTLDITVRETADRPAQLRPWRPATADVDDWREAAEARRALARRPGDGLRPGAARGPGLLACRRARRYGDEPLRNQSPAYRLRLV